ncbi:nuclear valosin-containing protein-like isoform X1 [Polyodon spathula]|uniref:nuclear valosin-containing protein-like isoform X1 n=2 Tax=Polyodon spathula TaxID=7913 RepID=UPI001B7F133A|nr:nuclear valosin-containing protein-like isoform X1 [Polyodon spathula]
MKNRGGYFVDNRLKERVKQYLRKSTSQFTDLSVMAADLQRMYSTEYGRRKRNAFRIQLEKVYTVLCNESDLSALEGEHLAKRARQSQGADGEKDSFSEDSTDSDDQPEYPPTNQMNNSLMSLYRKGAPDSVAPTLPKDQPAHSSTPRPAPSKTPKGGWFVDTTPGRIGEEKEESILIDLCEETQEAPNPEKSLLETDKKKKGKMKNGKRRQEGEARGIDGEIESIIMNKKVKLKAPELQYSTVKFEDVGGNEETMKEVCKMLIHMRHPEVYQKLGVVPPRGFLLHGPPGCGKTLLAQAIAGEMELPMLKVAATEMVSGVSGESEQKLRELFDQAVTSAPCILFIDEIDAITPKREVASKDMERRIVAQLLTCMDDLNALAATAQVMVIGATNRPDSLDPALRRAGRFDREICLGIPDEGARLRILQTLCRKLKLPESFDFQQLAHLTPGYVGADLMALCREAAMRAVNRVLIEMQSSQAAAAGGQPYLVDTKPVEQEQTAVPNQQPETIEEQTELLRLLRLLKDYTPLSEEQLEKLHIEMEDFTSSLCSIQPSAKREGFATVPDVTWADIGALEEIRQELTMAILAPVRNPDQFKALGLSAPAGVLLAGPPGCGKTLLAKAVANESGLNFISVKGPELLNMYVGESERAVRQVFQRAQNSAPCVIFFDEIDALCPRRTDRESGASVRVVNQLLTEMDGLETRKQVFIMAATNRPDIIDPAILRPGRLDKSLYIGLPPPKDRFAILQTITKCGRRPLLETDVNLEEIAHDKRSDCFTGADLSALVREASINALQGHLCLQAPAATNAPVAEIRVSRQNFEDALKKVKPSVSKRDQLMYDLLKESLCG